MHYVEVFFESIVNTTTNIGSGVGLGLLIIVPLWILVLILAAVKNSGKRWETKKKA